MEDRCSSSAEAQFWGTKVEHKKQLPKYEACGNIQWRHGDACVALAAGAVLCTKIPAHGGITAKTPFAENHTQRLSGGLNGASRFINLS